MAGEGHPVLQAQFASELSEFGAEVLTEMRTADEGHGRPECRDG